MDGPASFSSGEPVPNSSFTKTFDHPGTFIVGSDGALGSQGVVVVVRDGPCLGPCSVSCKIRSFLLGSQVAPPTLAKNIANTVRYSKHFCSRLMWDYVTVRFLLDTPFISTA